MSTAAVSIAPTPSDNTAPLRVHHLTTTLRGGAGGAAQRIFNAQREAGLEVRGWTGFGGDPAPAGWQSLAWRPGPGWRRHRQRLRLSLAKKGRPRSPEPLSVTDLSGPTPLPSEVTDVDALHLHWIGGRWLDYPSFVESLPRGLAVVWTLHDLNAVMPLSHYFDARETEGPGGRAALPSLDHRWFNPLGRGLVARAWEAKQALFARCRVHLVAVAQWQLSVLENSPLGRAAARTQLIRYPFALDPDTPPPSRAQARRRLGLPEDGRYVLLGAANLANPRKGVALAFEALRQGEVLPGGEPLGVLTFGAGQPSAGDAARVTQAFGHVKDPEELALIYAAADVFVTPALQESCSQTGLEALAQGTPVVCFDDTGSTEYTVNGETGVVAPTRHAGDLSRAITRALTDPGLGDQRRVFDAFVASIWGPRFRPDVQTMRYRDLYESLRAPQAGGAK